MIFLHPKPRNLSKGAKLAALAFLLVIATSPAVVITPIASTKQLISSANNSFSTAIGNFDDYPVLRSYAGEPYVFAKAFLLLDADTNEVISAKNQNLSLPVASTTKMVTALTALQLMSPDDEVVVTNHSTSVPDSNVGLLPGEKLSVLSLLRGALIASGNDATYAIAEAYSQKNGDIKPFVAKMNNYVLDHGLKKTKFFDPAGLDDNGRSTAFELSQIARLLLENPLLSGIVGQRHATISSLNGEYRHEIESSNRLILPDSGYYLPGVLGIKTGFMYAAGHSLVSALEMNGHTYIGVILNTDEYSITASASEMRKLFIWARSSIARQTY